SRLDRRAHRADRRRRYVMLTTEQLAARAEADRKEAFAHWIDQAVVRLGMSLIPAGEHTDALVTLLRSAFEGGYASGQAHVGVEIMTALLARREKEGKQ